MDIQSKRKCDKLLRFLQQQLRLSGLDKKFVMNSSEDSYEQLEKVIREMIFYLEEPDDEMKNQIQLQVRNNEVMILECLKNFLGVNQEMNIFSKLLYEQECSLEVYKSFRKLYEAVNSASNTLYHYQSQDQSFLQQKEELISRNISISEQIFKNAAENESINKKEYDSQQELIEELRQQIDALNEILKQNDQEFGVEIQKYNNTMYELQETIREYELRMDKVRDYQGIIEDLQHKIIRFKEQKYRDQMLIDNMSKKIRAYEKERGGSEIFLSPRGSRRQIGSPNSKILNTSSAYTTNPYELMRNRSNYGSKLITQNN